MDLFADTGVALLGGTAGVGLESACRFAELGARGLALMGRNAERGAQACDAVRARAAGANVHFVSVDGSDPVSAQQAAARAWELLGGVEVLVTSTGPSRLPRLLHTIPIEDVSPTLDELVLPPLHMMAALLPLMRERGRGAVVNVASDAAKVATPGESLIGAAMAAIVMFSRAAALEAKREGVRINVVTPSLIADTPGAEMLFGDPFSAKLFEKAGAMASLGVPGPGDLADTILFLAGPGAKRITGQALSVNGGISAA
ncbi:MAG TPA: SDR family oxidoreductase [Solirubrobacteraceae bacterium]|nr:SDR family oxidoreductase [Solirubrobacteraceae bacterium]